MKRYLLIILLLALPNVVLSESYWQQRVGYKIDVQLDTTNNTVSGTELVTYYNQSPDTLENLYFHLLPNAFESDTTQSSREAISQYNAPPEPPYQSKIDIDSFTIHLGKLQSTTFKVRDTELSAPLPAKLVPGGSLTIEIEFTNHLHEFRGEYRGGYRGNQYDITQWYPKVAVYDQDGWHNTPWHYDGEFYGEFGTFDVTVDVPQNFIVGATGVVVHGDPGWNAVQYDTTENFEDWFGEYVESKSHRQYLKSVRRKVTFHAENVHTFAWSTSPDFIYEHGEYKGTDINIFYRTFDAYRWHKKALKDAYNSLEWLDKKIGPYGYPQVTVIDGLLGGGMEYPMLVMDESADESLALHEIGHIYFFGMLGNNEMDEAWLDEGFTTFQTQLYLWQKYAPEGREPDEIQRAYPSFLGKLPRISAYVSDQNEIIDYQLSGLDEPISKPAYKFSSSDAYYLVVYTKAELMLNMLKYVMGKTAFWRGMQKYYKTWQFKHVNEARFRAVMQSETDTNLDWFFDQWLHNTGCVDYAIDNIRVSQTRSDSFKVDVNIEKKGSFMMPVIVELQTKDGHSQHKLWMSSREKGSVTFYTSLPVKKVILDPDNQILDVDYMNNSSGLPNYDFVPNIPGYSYHPRDAFVVKSRPSLWYNEVDGAKIGVHLDRSYLGDRRRMQLGLWYGSKSGQIDYDVNYSDRLYTVRPQLRYKLRSATIEGRQWNEVQFLNQSWRGWGLLPKSKWQVGFRNIALTDSAYLADRWEQGVDNQVYAQFRYDFRGINWFSHVTTDLITSQNFLGSNFNFNKLSVEWQYEERRIYPVKIFGRLFGGTSILGDRMPAQEKYSISDGGQFAYFNKYYARSQDSFFGLQNAQNYLLVPGEGNVRGYRSAHLPNADNILAANIEVQQDADWWSPYRGMAVIGFFDIAYAGLNGNFDNKIDETEVFADAGLGISLNRRIFGIPFYMRIDVPFWVNKPKYFENESDQIGPRLLVSFERLF